MATYPIVLRAPDGSSVRIDRFPVVLGRFSAGSPVQPDCDLSPFDREGGVSRRHASIDWRDGRLYVTDLNSSNGTRLNGYPVPGGQTVEIGPRGIVALGGLPIAVEVEGLPPGPMPQQAPAGAPAPAPAGGFGGPTPPAAGVGPPSPGFGGPTPPFGAGPPPPGGPLAPPPPPIGAPTAAPPPPPAPVAQLPPLPPVGRGSELPPTERYPTPSLSPPAGAPPPIEPAATVIASTLPRPGSAASAPLAEGSGLPEPGATLIADRPGLETHPAPLEAGGGVQPAVAERAPAPVAEPTPVVDPAPAAAAEPAPVPGPAPVEERAPAPIAAAEPPPAAPAVVGAQARPAAVEPEAPAARPRPMLETPGLGVTPGLGDAAPLGGEPVLSATPAAASASAEAAPPAAAEPWGSDARDRVDALSHALDDPAVERLDIIPGRPPMVRTAAGWSTVGDTPLGDDELRRVRDALTKRAGLETSGGGHISGLVGGTTSVELLLPPLTLEPTFLAHRVPPLQSVDELLGGDAGAVRETLGEGRGVLVLGARDGVSAALEAIAAALPEGRRVAVIERRPRLRILGRSAAIRLQSPPVRGAAAVDFAMAAGCDWLLLDEAAPEAAAAVAASHGIGGPSGVLGGRAVEPHRWRERAAVSLATVAGSREAAWTLLTDAFPVLVTVTQHEDDAISARLERL